MEVKSKNSQVELEELQGFKLIEKFRKILQSTNSHYSPHPSELDPKRKLAQNDYFSLFLFTYLNPVLKNMRGLCEATNLDKIQETVSSNSVSLGSFPKLNVFSIQNFCSLSFKRFQNNFSRHSATNVFKRYVRNWWLLTVHSYGHYLT